MVQAVLVPAGASFRLCVSWMWCCILCVAVEPAGGAARSRLFSLLGLASSSGRGRFLLPVNLAGEDGAASPVFRTRLKPPGKLRPSILVISLNSSVSLLSRQTSPV